MPDAAQLSEVLQGPSEIAGAIADWMAAIGAINVSTDSAELADAATATFSEARLIPAILRPGSREDVQACLRVANRHGVPVYPISSGRNWGYGSRLAAVSGCALMDLRRMNRILDFSEELGYVTIEPGVTQRQLFGFLRERRSGLWMDATGASPECSIVGNTVERGFGHTPYSDHFGHACGIEAVLANGEVVETGFGRFPGAHAAPLYHWGVGPSIDGLFSQSNLGIVTRMSVWLMPAPEKVEAFFFRCDDDGGLHALIEALRPLRLGGVLRSAVHIGNDYKVLAGIQQYPWEEAGGRTPLPPEVVRGMRRKLNFGAWNGSGALYGSARQIAEARRMVRAALRGRVNKLQFLDERKLRFAERFAKPYQMLTGWDLSRTLALVKPVFKLMQGVPTAQPLQSCYWRKRGPVPAEMNPDRDRCGLLWVAPILPLRGEDAVRGSQIAIRTVLDYGFEPAISLTLLTERTIDSVISISYDRELPGEDQRARQCHDELLRRLTASGYYPYRLGVQSMWLMRQPSSYNDFLARLREAIDPGHILAPGRYEG
ncbi:MAG: FAD-binding oxidoreductase [Bryobacteraceae bacterium]